VFTLLYVDPILLDRSFHGAENHGSEKWPHGHWVKRQCDLSDMMADAKFA